MPYYKRRRTWAVARRAKYSVQQKAFATAVQGNTTTTIEVVPSTVVEGMRKVKHITVNASIQGAAGATATDAMYWAIVYVPQGTTPNAINIATAASTPGMYEPNQFVMNCGVVDGTAGPIRFSSPVGRNLNDGDSIYLLIRPLAFTTGQTFTLVATVRYAISLS